MTTGSMFSQVMIFGKNLTSRTNMVETNIISLFSFDLKLEIDDF